MEPPLWYKVQQRILSFRNCLLGTLDVQDRDYLPVLILSSLYGHEPYIEGIHIIQMAMKLPRPSYWNLLVIYLYWIFGRSFLNDPILYGNIIAGTFRRVKINLPDDFSYEYLIDWIDMLYYSFFELSPITKPIQSYEPGNLSQLKEALEYLQEISTNTLILSKKTVDKAYSLSIAHRCLKEFRAFLKGEAYPKLIKSYRRCRTFLEKVISLYWPQLLLSLEKEAPFEDWELELIYAAHQKLHQEGDFDFYQYYNEKLIQLFGSNHKIVIHLKSLYKPSPLNESRIIYRFLEKLNPIERRKFFLQPLMVSDRQLEDFVETVRESSFEEAFRPYYLANKSRIENEIKLVSGHLINDQTLGSQTSIYLYPLEDLIFYVNGSSIYVFLSEELQRFQNKLNPFTRQPLPDFLFDLPPNPQAESLDTIWQKVIRRLVDLEKITQA